MDEKARTRLSKRLSYHLRHAPQEIGLTLEPGGWVAVGELLAALARAGLQVTRAELEEVVATSPKQRYGFDDSGGRIRANQGHSVDVDLQLAPAEPPAILYHGTGEGVVALIRESGLKKMARHHVHLSADEDTARNVGGRHGKPVVLQVDAAAMRKDGIEFFCSENGVWLVDAVDPKYLK
jgi:putative RNA 2'-phosphotransferase